MKFNKKVVAGVAATALALSAATGFTLAYFTDSDGDLTNTATFGHVDIELTETSNDIGLENVTGTPTVVEPDTETIFSGLTFSRVLPGDTYSKIPLVTVVADDPATTTVNEASEDCYIRVKITLTVDEGDVATVYDANDDGDFTAEDLVYTFADGNPDTWLDIDTTVWNVVVEDDSDVDEDPSVLVLYAYYDGGNGDIDDSDAAVLSAGDSKTLFTEVSFPTVLDNTATDDNYQIVLFAEAIQARNYGTVLELDGSDRIIGWGTPEPTILPY